MSNYKELWGFLESYLDKKVYYASNQMFKYSYKEILDKMRELERTSMRAKTVHLRSPRIKRKEKSDG